MKPERNWHYHEASSSTNYYCRQQDTSYCQPDYYNQLQQYRHDRTTKQDPYISDYDNKKWENCSNHSGIRTPDMKEVPIIPIGK